MNNKSNKELFLNLLLEDDKSDDKRDDKSDDKSYDKCDNIKEKCLISNELLETNYITLKCRHKFNFKELYNEVVEQKTKKILDNSKLKLNEIKCPYCRNITDSVLPYFKYYENKQIRGVNHPPELSIKLYECTYIDKSLKVCGKNACATKYGIMCNNHMKYTINEEEKLATLEPEILKTYSNNTITQLKEKLRKYNLKLTGNKQDLINRLIINDSLINYNVL